MLKGGRKWPKALLRLLLYTQLGDLHFAGHETNGLGKMGEIISDFLKGVFT